MEEHYRDFEFSESVREGTSSENDKRPSNIFENARYKDIRKKHNLKQASQNTSIHKLEGLPCPKCKSKNTFVYSSQVRSGDEATTWYIDCTACNTKHRI